MAEALKEVILEWVFTVWAFMPLKRIAAFGMVLGLAFDRTLVAHDLAVAHLTRFSPEACGNGSQGSYSGIMGCPLFIIVPASE